MNEKHPDNTMSVIRLLQLHLMNQLPEDVTVIDVPIKRTAYGDYQVASEDHQPFKDDKYQDGACESIEIGQYFIYDRSLIFGRMMFAGYGEETKTLVIGRELQEDGGLCPAIRAEDVRRRIEELGGRVEQDLRNERMGTAQDRQGEP